MFECIFHRMQAKMQKRRFCLELGQASVPLVTSHRAVVMPTAFKLKKKNQEFKRGIMRSHSNPSCHLT